MPPHPTVGELVGDACAELSGVDGKVATTVRLLLTRPRRLTSEMLSGRRARFIGPLRLYLTCSVPYFLVAAATPDRATPQSKRSPDFEIGGLPVVVSPNGSAATTSPDSAPIGRDTMAAAASAEDSVPAGVWRRRKWALAHMNKDPKAVEHAKTANLPRVLFALMPVYSLLVRAIYRRSTYAEHLIVASVALLLLAVLAPFVA